MGLLIFCILAFFFPDLFLWLFTIVAVVFFGMVAWEIYLDLNIEPFNLSLPDIGSIIFILGVCTAIAIIIFKIGKGIVRLYRKL